MIIHVPDPHPGRCLNHRRDPSDQYGVRSLRCLRMEGHPEACRFPDPPPEPRINATWHQWTSADTRPEPWVEP